MKRLCLFTIPLLLMSGSLWANIESQTNWSGGPGVAGPVSAWGDHFYLGTDLDWDTEPGQLKLVIDQGENVIDPAVNGAYGCDLVDVDQDGDLDMAGCSYYDDYVHWWKNNGAGESWTEYTVGTINGPVFVKVADINMDGARDIVVAAADANQIVWYRNNSGGTTWTANVLETDFDARQISLSDFDGDGDPDIVGVSSETGDVVWWRNRVNQSLPWIKTYIDGSLLGAYACDTGDIDNDGDVDVFCTSTYYGSIVLYTNDLQYTGSWIKSTVASGLSNPYSIAVTDVDSDDTIEVVSANWAGISYYDYSGGSWSAETIDATVTNVTSVVEVDMDGDGDMDLASCSSGSSDDVYWYQNLPGDSWEKSLVDGDFQGGIFVVAGDVDDDGVPDVAGAATDEDRMSWWRIGGFTSPGVLYSSIYQVDQVGYWQSMGWSLEQPAGTSIYFNLRASDNPSAMGSWSPNISGTNPSSIIGLLEDGTGYLQYRVTLQTSNPYATPSLKDLYVYWSPTGIEEEEGDSMLSVASSNPSFGPVELVWTLENAGNAVLTIYDTTGRLVREVESGWFEAGEHSTTVEGLPTGAYAACLQGEGFTALHRVVVLD